MPHPSQSPFLSPVVVVCESSQSILVELPLTNTGTRNHNMNCKESYDLPFWTIPLVCLVGRSTASPCPLLSCPVGGKQLQNKLYQQTRWGKGRMLPSCGRVSTLSGWGKTCTCLMHMYTVLMKFLPFHSLMHELQQKLLFSFLQWYIHKMYSQQNGIGKSQSIHTYNHIFFFLGPFAIFLLLLLFQFLL